MASFVANSAKKLPTPIPRRAGRYALCDVVMEFLGKCKCGNSTILLEGAESLGALNPRICDCEFCKSNPSAIVSGPGLTITVSTENGGFTNRLNGSEQAVFYHCAYCNQMLAVGAEIAGQQKGALNALLLDDQEHLGEPVAIQPRLLEPHEKLKRWSNLWCELRIVHA